MITSNDRIITFDGNPVNEDGENTGQLDTSDGLLVFFHGATISVHDATTQTWRIVADNCTRITIERVFGGLDD